MKNPSVLLIFLSLLFLLIPIMQQMIKVNQENKLALVADVTPEKDASISEYDDADVEDMDVYFDSNIEFYLYDGDTTTNSNIEISNPCKQKLKSPPPQV
ncbi:hypothetical protein [Labilibaculum sp.]|uniref:hypothetical protein n=1 Tax=Labilibaculum sp. TaxID=2060723 RepID=UPI002AA76E0F|nr:hypothetical protein [Labilibaculum sp.]